MSTKYEDGWYLVWSVIESPDGPNAEVHRVVNGYDRKHGQKVSLLAQNGWSYHPVSVVTEGQLIDFLDRAYQAGWNGALNLLTKIEEVASEGVQDR